MRILLRSSAVISCFLLAGSLGYTQSLDVSNDLDPLTAQLAPSRESHLPMTAVLEELNIEQLANSEVVTSVEIGQRWWAQHVREQLIPKSNPSHIGLDDLLLLALEHSTQIAIDREIPLIRETAVAEADADFDWNAYVNNLWNDVSEPIGSSLTVGATSAERFFSDHRFDSTAGLRRRTRNGAQFDLSQKIGFQNNNSDFFLPNDQGTTVLSLGFTQPLLRGRGVVYNTSLNVLTRIDVESASLEFSRQLQAHLLEIFRSYWRLYLERGTLAQKVNLYVKTRDILNRLNSRLGIDARKSQVASAQAALASRKSDLFRAQAAVKNAETRLKILINAPQLQEIENLEIVPLDSPSLNLVFAEETNEREMAFQCRPEIQAAIKEIKAGAIRQDVAKHELMPLLNLVSEVYLSGLRGETDIPQAFADQFSEGAPSYSIGLNFEVPIGNRAARARQKRRSIELRQLETRYRNTLENIGGEVEIAVRELQTGYREVLAKQQALESSMIELEAIASRWERNADGQGSSGLQLESLLRAQERVTNAESELLRSLVTYNVATANLRRANGTLLQTHDIQLRK